MANETKDSPVIDIEGTFDRTERYIEENKKSLLLIVGAVVVLAGGFLGWKYLYQKPRNEEAAAALFPAETAFAKDSFNLAMNGKGEMMGLIAIADEYGNTPAGNLANYYLGICYLNTGKPAQAIEALNEFDADDKFVGTLAIGLLGDAHMENKQIDEAISYYLKAAGRESNKFTSPVFLKKAAMAYEDKGNKAEALKLYQQIKAEYPDSPEAQSVDKYIYRTGGTVE
jgi:tetratricopeptide (TPR) repeat protein